MNQTAVTRPASLRKVNASGRWLRWTFASLSIGAIVALSAGHAGSAQANPEAWPEQIVTLEELRPLTPFRLRSSKLLAKGEVRGPSILQAHIDASGLVARVVLMESCGNGDLDEAAIQGLRAMAFSPFRKDGVPVQVTLVVPIHIPQRLGRTR